MEKNEKMNALTEEELANVDGGVGKVKRFNCMQFKDEATCRAHAADNCHWDTIKIGQFAPVSMQTCMWRIARA